jgi:hexosaminidase
VIIRTACTIAAIAMTFFLAGRIRAEDASSLRLVPFPKEVHLGRGSFKLNAPLVLETEDDGAALIFRLIEQELRVAGLPRATITLRRLEGSGHVVRLVHEQGRKTPPLSFREGATAEDYVLSIQPDAITIGSPGIEGLLYGVQTLRQLIRSNRREDDSLPCLTINDWPSIRWRAFQDDMTRGPSTKLDYLKREVDLGSYLKQNIFTYYMEYQYAFTKHPLIGPQDGSLTPEELKRLVGYASPLRMNIMGNQQSFGHMEHILAHKEYEQLGETSSVLTPAREETYKLLDDLYSEQIPLLRFEFFNVDCDETGGLGTGPSKELAERIGVGGVYAQHMLRVHDLVSKKYGKRMLMWGDIILAHREHLGEIPKDTIMLTWGYDPRQNFESQIIPFAESGFEFFVCPGVNCWSRILPDFGAATVNIQNFVRDGAKHRASGVLNTSWDDDGENLNAANWHGFAWGAECAWNASATSPDDFNRRLGAVLFGEKGDEFGRAIELLSKTHSLPGMQGMNNRAFWDPDFDPIQVADIDEERLQSEELLDVVRPAIGHLEKCKKEASCNADLLESLIFGARRMEFIAQCRLNHIKAALAYREASSLPRAQAAIRLKEAEESIRSLRDEREALGREFRSLWLRECKPYALDWTMKRYEDVVAEYDRYLGRLSSAQDALKAGKPLPSGKEVGLELVETVDDGTNPQSAKR